ncbi:hypothetical protein XELAEV_18003174mg [Xenopus laevis]|nr:hypothetical protein XELAEV_18003174mg [Xenopus laevis]
MHKLCTGYTETIVQRLPQVTSIQHGCTLALFRGTQIVLFRRQDWAGELTPQCFTQGISIMVTWLGLRAYTPMIYTPYLYYVGDTARLESLHPNDLHSIFVLCRRHG